MANDTKKPDLNNPRNPTSTKPDTNINPNINKNIPDSGSGSQGNSDFGGSSRNTGKDMNKDMGKGLDKNMDKNMDKDMDKPGGAGFKASNRDADLDRTPGIKRTDNEVSGGSSSKGSPTSGSGRNH
jgi:hypothetical protein